MRKFLLPILLFTCVVIFSSFILFFNVSNTQALDETGCLSCHGVPTLNKTSPDGKKISLYVNEKAVNTAAHRYIDCTTCHTDKPHQVQTPLNKQSLAEKCGSCHKYEYKLHLNSVHGQQLVKGNADVATCVDCHSATSNPHNVVRVLEYNASTYKKNIAETCANCHKNIALMEGYGIVEKVYESYMRSYHGKAIQLGTYESTQLDEATCVNCHGFHDIKSVKDPQSSVSGVENLAKTCEKCHPDAGVEFARGFLGHKEASSTNKPIVHYTEIFFNVLLISVLGFGLIVVLTAVIRFSSNKWRK